MQNIAAPIVQRNWWIMALRGLLAVIFGLIALLAPGIALLAFIYVFAAYALVDGGIAVITAIQERELLYRWGWILFEGILRILVGIIAFANPALTALVLLYLIAAWAIVTGIMEIVAAFAIREFVSREWVLALAGIVSVAFGILLSRCWHLINSLVGWHLRDRVRSPVHRACLPTPVLGIIGHSLNASTFLFLVNRLKVRGDKLVWKPITCSCSNPEPTFRSFSLIRSNLQPIYQLSTVLVHELRSPANLS